MSANGMGQRWIGTLPSTNAFLALFLTTTALTALLVVGSGLASIIVSVRTAGASQPLTWVPPSAWLDFLNIGLGTGAVQFIGKRVTYKPDVVPEDAVPEEDGSVARPAPRAPTEPDVWRDDES